MNAALAMVNDIASVPNAETAAGAAGGEVSEIPTPTLPTLQARVALVVMNPSRRSPCTLRLPMRPYESFLSQEKSSAKARMRLVHSMNLHESP